MNLPTITDIQRYSIHDGDGIRTTVFFKGCPLSCLWCHNPETQRFCEELLVHRDRCVGCGACEAACPQQGLRLTAEGPVIPDALCLRCDTCLNTCLHEVYEHSGRTYTVPELVKLLLKDQPFYEQSGGGVTLSGGEVMVQDVEYLVALMRQLKRRGVSVYVDTCGHAPEEAFEAVLPYVDAFLYDIKLMDELRHKAAMGLGNRRILSNLCFLAQRGATLILRIPVIGGINDRLDDMQAIVDFLHTQQIAPLRIHLLPYHAHGMTKYEQLHRAYPAEHAMVPTEEHLKALQRCFTSQGFADVRIGG